MTTVTGFPMNGPEDGKAAQTRGFAFVGGLSPPVDEVPFIANARLLDGINEERGTIEAEIKTTDT